MNNKKRNILLFILIFGCFLSVMNQTLLNVALSDLMVVFDVSAATVQWLATGFMLVNGVLVPVTAFLMKRFTTKQLFIASMMFLLIGTIICAAAPAFGFLLAGRMIQAAGAGIIMPLMMSVIMVIFPVDKRGSAMGLIGFAMIFAPAIAPVFAGFVIEFISWRFLFIILIPFVLIVIFMAFKYLVNVSETSKAKIDLTSVILSTIGFGFLLYGFSSAGQKGWNSAEVLGSIIIGLIVIILFTFRQLRSNDPLLNLDVFKNRVFTVTTLINVCVTMIMYADLILLPIYLQTGRNFTAFDAGLLLLPGAIINAFLSPVAGKMYDRYGARPLFIIGLLLIIPSIWMVTDLTGETSYMYIMMRTILLRIGLSFITMPLNTAALNSLSSELATHGSAVINTIRQIAGAVGTAIVVAVYSLQAEQYAENLSVPADQIEGTSTILGIGDAYYFMLVLAAIALILVMFMPRKKLTV